MKAILSADRKWGLGYQGRLLVSIPSDLRFFRETTMGHVVVMGRKTLATLPAGQPLKGRTNIILSRDPEWTVRGATVVHSIKELMEVLKPYEDDDIYVAGGGEIYRQLLPYCDTAYVTRIDMTYQADTFFENLKMATIETAKESERGIVDMETLKQTNQSLISTLDEVMKIQEDGRQKRAAAEVELVQLENDIKKKMLELSAGGQH